MTIRRAAEGFGTWLVVCRGHGWLHSDLDHAKDDAAEIAEGFAVEVKVTRNAETRNAEH